MTKQEISLSPHYLALSTYLCLLFGGEVKPLFQIKQALCHLCWSQTWTKSLIHWRKQRCCNVQEKAELPRMWHRLDSDWMFSFHNGLKWKGKHFVLPFDALTPWRYCQWHKSWFPWDRQPLSTLSFSSVFFFLISSLSLIFTLPLIYSVTLSVLSPYHITLASYYFQKY